MYVPAGPLSSLRCGETAVVSSLHLQGAIRSRLLSIGLVPGTEVRCLLKKKNSLAAYEIRGAVAALRMQDAALILVKKT
ncbi:MAG: ferrous iron transport protein A [Ruminococcus sp.]|nr:ferrous iron transport protein A [Ruminococcus sp.]